jgi:hypothetical protein
MGVQPVIFSTPKENYQPTWWEDGGGYAPGRTALARIAVADGATEGYQSRLWVSQLIEAFLTGGEDSPGRIDRGSLGSWLARMQDLWSLDIPVTADYIDQVKIGQGAFATFVGCQLEGLDGGSAPCWRAVAAGDAVLFHVRGRRLLDHLPPLSVADFGTAPDGLSTLPDQLPGIVERLQFGNGELIPDDLLFAATDAMAKWMLTWVENDDQETLWRALAALADPADFEQLINEQRRAKAMKDDDVTLLRVRLLSRPAEMLVIQP